jgi:hypothetical protein
MQRRWQEWPSRLGEHLWILKREACVTDNKVS